MNAHVDEGTEPLEVAEYIEKLLTKINGKLIIILVNSAENRSSFEMDSSAGTYENLMKKYNKLS
jgi:hypothetical protein